MPAQSNHGFMLMARAVDERWNDQGFSLLELIIVTLVMGIVLSVAGTALYSMSQGSSRGDTLVNEEQSASTAVVNLAKDIRSAHTISSSVSGSPSSSEVVLLVNQPTTATVDGVKVCQSSSANPDYTPVPYQLVEWLYQPTAGTLTRMVLNCGATGNPSLGTTWSLGGSSPTQNVKLSVSNGATSLFTYFNQYGTNISTALSGAIASCTTRVGIDLKLASSVHGAAGVEEVQNAALTDQLNVLSQPGNGQC